MMSVLLRAKRAAVDLISVLSKIIRASLVALSVLTVLKRALQANVSVLSEVIRALLWVIAALPKVRSVRLTPRPQKPRYILAGRPANLSRPTNCLPSYPILKSR